MNRKKIANYIKDGITLKDVLKSVSEKRGVSMAKIKQRSRGGPEAKARRAFIQESHKEYGFLVGEIARFLNVSGSAVSMLLRKGDD